MMAQVITFIAFLVMAGLSLLFLFTLTRVGNAVRWALLFREEVDACSTAQEVAVLMKSKHDDIAKQSAQATIVREIYMGAINYAAVVGYKLAAEESLERFKKSYETLFDKIQSL